ncbi:hypothetical protein [Kribbella caucasensis]|nr:hypothetical protein [Kribbella sp. VKM Ac-2527]
MLDALVALDAHRAAVIVIGAQAVYMRTSAAAVALAEATKDSDLAVDPRQLGEHPLLEEAMKRAGFVPNPTSRQPGAWLSPAGIPVDLMVPEAFAGAGGKQARGARIPPHSKMATRRARGLEAALIDHSPLEITALDPADDRRYTVKVAGTAALLVAKLHKIAERSDAPTRLVDKDAHDSYRILIDIETAELAEAFGRLCQNKVSSAETEQALVFLTDLFAAGPTALGSLMAGRAETGIGEPETVALQVSVLAGDLLTALRR